MAGIVMRQAVIWGFLAGLASGGAWAAQAEPGGRCSAPALLDDPAIVAQPSARPLAPGIYARIYGPRDAGVATGPCADNDQYLFGTGEGDITGPLFDQGMAGYAKPEQLSKGKIDRQFARAFVIAPACDPAARVALVSVDLGLMYHGVRQEVVKRLDGALGYQNLMITATHSHATAAGQSHHDLYNMSAGGHDAQAFETLVSGIVTAIEAALVDFERAGPGTISFAQAELLNASVQRSRAAYDQNPEAERAAYTDVEGNPVTIDRNAITLTLAREGAAPALMNWFAVHGTSISSANRLLSGDNKGWAALMAEQKGGPRRAGFFQGTLGDVSPNITMEGLSDSDLRDLDSPEFLARGGGRNDRESTVLSALRQMKAAKRGASSPTELLQGPVTARHVFIDMRTAHLDDDPARRTCSPAYGFGAPAGAEDGRGPISEGWRCSDISGFSQFVARAGLWGALKFVFGFDVPDGFFSQTGCRPARDDPDGPYGCHGEKPILAPLGYAVTGTGQPITAPVVPMQILTIGNFAVIGLPFEITTMSGRRIKTAVLDALETRGIDYAVVTSHANGYSHYLTTPEEYDLQLYEGASTIFGQHELEIVVQELTRLASGGDSPFAVADYTTAPTSYQHTPDTDEPKGGPGGIGAVVTEPAETTAVDDGPVAFTVRGPNPRNTLLGRDLYVRVERQAGEGQWVVAASDRSYETELEYDASNGALTGRWYPPLTAGKGPYRMVIEGRSGTAPFETPSRSFALQPCP